MTNDIKKRIKKYEQAMIDFRRDLHQFPELSMEEFETTKKVAKELDAIGVEYRLTEPTGIIASIKGTQPGKTVMIRGDMDALPVEELSENLSYKSEIEGKMHACGHDTHTAMLLTAAKVLVELKDQIKGEVRLIFQPGEETVVGAKIMMAQGALDNVDNVFGIHISSRLPTNKIACLAGPSQAAADTVKIHFEGKGGHAAQPNQGIDAAVVQAQFISTVQTVISREIDPLKPAVFTVGTVVAGQRFNVIAQDAYLEGTVRTFHKDIRDIVEEKIKQYAHEVSAIYGATATIDYQRVTEVVDNDEKSAQLVNTVTKKYFGDEYVAQGEQSMGAEDFSFYMIEKPGAFAYVGSANEEKDTCWAHHHGRFNVDEDALVTGAELYVQYALEYLNQEVF